MSRKKFHIKQSFENEGLQNFNVYGKSVMLKHGTINRINSYFKTSEKIDIKINRLLDIVTPDKSAFIWCLDIEKYNEEKSRREN